MPYLEIYPLENCANKLANQLDEILAAKPNMYSKTKQRYKELAISLLQSVEKISTILEEDSLANMDHSEFNAHHSLNSLNCISDMQEALSAVKARVEATQQFIGTDVPNVNKLTIIKYGQVLAEGANHPFKYVEARQCARLIYRWFQARFGSRFSSFKYNIANVPSWITSIILCFGKYHSINQLNTLHELFDEWIQAVEGGQNNWALPYCVYTIEKHHDTRDLTINAALICDILMDEVYYKLTDYYSPEIVCPMSSFPVADAIRQHDPSKLPELRARLHDSDQFREKYQLTSIQEEC